MNGYAWLTGYLEISLYGDNPERVINMAMTRGIYLWDIRQRKKGSYELKIRIGGYKALRNLVRRSSCRIKIIGKRGFPFEIMRARKRKVLVIGVLFFCAVLYILSSFVWFIEVQGNKKIEEREIKLIASGAGLKTGVPKAGLNTDEIRDKLISQIPELAWTGIRIQGTKVIIEVSEKTLIPTDDEYQAADLMARTEGKIEELLVLQGTPQVREGEYVQKGQVLINSWAYSRLIVNQDGTVSPGGTPQKVRALGLVRARVNHTGIGECAVTEEEDIDTGAETTIVLLRYQDWKVILKGPKTIPYGLYRQVSQAKTLIAGRNPGKTVELITTVYFEQKHETRQWGVEGAYLEAVRRAGEDVQKELPPDSRIHWEGSEPLESSREDLIRAKYQVTAIEDIGCYSNNP